MSEPSLAQGTARLNSGSDIEAGVVSPIKTIPLNSTGSFHQPPANLGYPLGR